MEWMAATFRRSVSNELKDTAYFMFNGYADLLFKHGGDCDKWDGPCPDDFFWTGQWDLPETDDFAKFEHIRGYEHDAGPTPPKYMTDRAIAAGRKTDFKRMVLHYVQPHRPYIANAVHEGRDLHYHEREPWNYLKNGGSRELVFGAYLDEIRYALDSIEVLLENLDANTVALSADHGDAFGELGMYGHGIGRFHAQVRFVPWATTTATDTGEYTPQFELEDVPPENDVGETLRALGYRDS